MAAPEALPSKQEKENPWLDAWKDPCGGLKLFSSHLALCDPSGTGEHMLVLADLNRNLKVYRNTDVHTSFKLLGIPVGVEVLFPDQSRIPSIAIPCGQYIYFYRNLRPYYKYEVPHEEYEQSERDLWNQPWHEEIPNLLLSESEVNEVSERTRKLLSINNIVEQEAFFNKYTSIPFHRPSFVTCVASLPTETGSSTVRSCLVFGTESKMVYIMEPSGNSFKHKVAVPDVPSILCTSGTMNMDYRIFIAGRSNVIYRIKNGQLLQFHVSVPATVCGLVTHLCTLFIACIDHRVYIKHFKGQSRGSLDQPCAITALRVFDHISVQSKQVLLVGLKNGTVRMYVNKILLHTLNIGGSISAMACGTYGRAENALIIITNEGNLNIKLLKRNYNFNQAKQTDLLAVGQDTPIELPKISKLYLDQTERERQKALTMHRSFQSDVLGLRMKVCDSYVKILREGLGPISHHGKFKMNIQVIGLGPIYKIRFEVRNFGSQPGYNLFLLLCPNQDYFQCLSNSTIKIPAIIPEIPYYFVAKVRNIHPEGCGDKIIVHLTDILHTEPMLSAIVEMPVVAEV